MSQRLAPSPDSLLPAAVQDYLPFHQESGHSDSTFKFYRKGLRLFLDFLRSQNHSMRIGDLTAGEVRRHMKHLLDLGQASRTRRSRLQAIKTFLNWCVDWEYLPDNPARRVKAPRSDHAYKPFPSPETLQALLNLCPLDCLVNARRAAILWLFASTGMRRRELADLKLEDLRFGEEGWIDILGKGGKYRASAFLDSEHAPVQQAMEAYLSYRSDDLPWLWVTCYDRRFSYHGIGKDLDRLAQQAGVKDALVDICHGWRRYCAVQAQEQEVDPAYILTNLGWNSYAMFNHYTRARLLERQRAIHAFQKFSPAQARGGAQEESEAEPPLPQQVRAAAPREAASAPRMPVDGPAVQWYEELGLLPGAFLAEVKAAFRKLARQCHPSLHPEDPEAALCFEAINAAYRGLTVR